MSKNYCKNTSTHQLNQCDWPSGFNPSQQLSTSQPLAHSPSVGWQRDSEG